MPKIRALKYGVIVSTRLEVESAKIVDIMAEAKGTSRSMMLTYLIEKGLEAELANEKEADCQAKGTRPE